MTRPIHYVVGLLIFISTAVKCQFRFDYTFNVKVGGWMKLHEVPADFFDAFRICDAEGSVLASPLNLNMKNAMLSLFKKTASESCALHTGIHSFIAKGAYASVEGIPLSRIPVTWAPNEPDNFNNGEDCIVMLQNGTMADVSCTETFPFICYKKKTRNMALNECGTIDDKYQLDVRTGSCYKFHNIGRSWNQAYMVCQAEGGHLAIINSETEALVIRELFAKYPAEVIFSPHKNGASIGFHDWGERGVWHTVQGQKLEESGYSKFAQGQPDNETSFAGRSSCGATFRDALLDDIWCSGTYIAFICEKRPDSLTADDVF